MRCAAPKRARMDRTIYYCITQAENGLKTEQYLRRLRYSAESLKQLKKNPECILVNQTPSRMNRRLKEGDVLTVRIIDPAASGHVTAVPLPFNIVYEDEDILVIHKPAGMPVHLSKTNTDNTLANALAWYYRAQGKTFCFRCAGRLDRDTSGLILVAKHFVSSGILSSMAARREIRRDYLAISRGHVSPREGTICAPLSRRPGPGILRIVDFEHGESAVTHYRVLSEKNGHSLILVTLETGRTHQIRIHMKHLGFPLSGDYLYNPDMEYISRQALHSYRLTFTHPVTGAGMVFTAPLPEDMLRILSPDILRFSIS